jgi:hypothetical protein
MGTKPIKSLGDAEFVVSIDDGYCEWSYKIEAPGNFSIHNLIEKLCEATGAQVPEGTVRRPWKPE